MFDTTINLGNLIEIAIFIVTLYAFHVRNIQRFVVLETKVDIMWSQLQKRLGMKDDD